VVGLGGVGSHAAQLLLRGGVRRLRLVDFDQVTLSSLNRHATATRADVGTSKATALRSKLLRIVPDAEVEACVELFNEAEAARLTAGAAVVLDCIDDLATKGELVSHCVRHGTRVLSALGAGGKADACALHIGRLDEVFNDPIARSMLLRIRKQKAEEAEAAAAAGAPSKEGAEAEAWWEEMAHQVTVAYSSEKQKVNLLPMPQGVDRASELGSQPNFRVRVMPVFPPLPAVVGAALAAHALSTPALGGVPVEPPARPVPSLTPSYMSKLYRTFLKHELKSRGSSAAEATLALHDVADVVCDAFRCRCAITGRRLHDPERPTFMLCRYDAARPPSATNVLFVISEAGARHERDGIGALAPPLRAQIDAGIARLGRRPSLFEQACREEGVTAECG
jgi:tRNA A37 threonylcarbamoyladenosine dehydratase